MYSSRVSLLSLVLSGFAVLPGVSNAQSGYFTSTDTDKNCASSGCHFIQASVPPTCNGCHGHGTHATIAKDSINLVATTNKTSYAPGDDISVTLSGGYQSGGWVRVNMYDSNGVLLVSNSTECPHNALSYAASCDLPVTLKTRALAGMTSLYVAWMGHENDITQAAKGAPISPNSVIGVGSRVARSPAPATHTEEIVLTNTFTVTASATDTSKGSGGGGSLDWLLISGLIGVFCARRISKRG